MSPRFEEPQSPDWSLDTWGASLVGVFSQAPSRDALVLEATRRALTKGYPFTIDAMGLRRAAGRVEGLVRDEFDEGKAFCARVRAHFLLMAAAARMGQ